MDTRYFGTNLLALNEIGANASTRATETDEDAYYRDHAPANRRPLNTGQRIRRFSMAMLALGALALLAVSAEAAGGGRTPDRIDDMREPKPMTTAIPTVDVDLELVLAVDVSHSMSGAELTQQRNGYVAAFRHPEVLSAIRSGRLGQIAVTYVEWAGPLEQRVVVPWTIVTGADDSARFAETLATAEPKPAIRTPPPPGGTSISSALLFASALFGGNDISGMRQTIDVSGDGPNNTGPPVTVARDTVVIRGATINGLPLILAPRTLALDDYYEACVIGGPGSFSITVSSPADFSSAVRHKLLLEIADLRPHVAPAGLRPPPRSPSELCNHWHRGPPAVDEAPTSFPGKHYLWTD